MVISDRIKYTSPPPIQFVITFVLDGVFVVVDVDFVCLFLFYEAAMDSCT